MINSILLFDIMKSFEDYGIIITVLVLAVIVSFIVIRNSQKRISSQEKKIDSLYTRIDELMVKFKHDEPNDLTGKFINYAENANKIQIQLYHMLQNFGADRISIYEYHNGGKNLSGVEFKKCSNTYEAVELETKPIIKELQNLPLGMNPLWSKILATRDDILIPNVGILEDTFLKSFLETQSIKAYYSSILLDYDKTPVGFITLEYYKNYKELTTEQLDEFSDIAIKIAVLINIK